MSDTAASLRHKIASAGELESVVRTMKAMAASSIGQYENAVRSLDDYFHTVQLGLIACLQQENPATEATRPAYDSASNVCAIVFGSDQGLVGQFNEAIAEYVVSTLAVLPGKKSVWAIGERLESRLTDSDLMPTKNFTLPNSINAITPLVGEILIEMEAQREQGKISQLYLFYNRPQSGDIYNPVHERLLPFDRTWRSEFINMQWPRKSLPEVINGPQQTLIALVHEYLFVSLFRACAESLASENASRLAAMQRAEKNIDEILEDLNRTFHRLRQSSIDEELFDVVSGFESLGKR
jgi:F-type H+-transporting ATPase subunit gamma